MRSLRTASALRSITVGVTAAVLLGLPATAASSSADAVTAVKAPRHETSIRFLDFDHTRGYGSPTHVRGQVTASVRGQRGAVQGVRVRLYRQLRGSSSWVLLGSDYTSHTAHPAFEFTARSKGNATYRVVYAGNDHLKRSRGATSVSVYRRITSSVEDGSGRFHGRVTPAYGGKQVALQKRTCASCGWRTVRTQSASRRGSFSFTTDAPAHGRFYFRVSAPASTAFITSYSGVYSTRQS